MPNSEKPDSYTKADTPRGRSAGAADADQGQAAAGRKPAYVHPDAAAAQRDGQEAVATPFPPGGICPNEPSDPVSEEAYDAFVAAMDTLIAQAPEPLQEGEFRDDLHPRGPGSSPVVAWRGVA